jgi:dTDP-4-dehydrorhamnose reductase
VKVLVTGARGQLGRDVVIHCQAQGDLVIGVDRADLDVTDEAAVRAFVAATAPDALINCAAYTAVDACETDAEAAMAVNGDAVQYLTAAASDAGAHLVQISTDYVFDGTQARPYREDDPPNPLSVYGQTKLRGEREALPDASVVRTSWLCGEHGSNVVKTALRLAREGHELAFVDDQRGCPTFAADLAPALRRLAVERRPGIHHVTNSRAVSWFEFVGEILAGAGLDPALVRPIATADLDPPRPAPRPANSVLDNAVWREAGFRELRDHEEALGDLLRRLG